MDLAVAPQAPSRTEQWLRDVQAQVEDELARLLLIADEQTLDSRWAEGFAQTREYALRPGKRLRPALVLAGYALGGRDAATDPGVWRFAAATELLHTFLLIHDDVADRADLRRGGPALHRMLAPARGGEDLAVVAGDHLFARAVEGMLESGLPGAAAATRYYLGVCRHTAVGQYLDLSLSSARLSEVTLFQTLKVATPEDRALRLLRAARLRGDARGRGPGAARAARARGPPARGRLSAARRRDRPVRRPGGLGQAGRLGLLRGEGAPSPRSPPTCAPATRRARSSTRSGRSPAPRRRRPRSPAPGTWSSASAGSPPPSG